ncbi:MAG TPA: hypothetical protein VMU87_02690 [Stellaceae bacterium]|nr:hypothetical protein [Stellaceae bacterium]
MPMSSDEARQTLKALERLIGMAELAGLRSPGQRAALRALRGRRQALRKLLAARTALHGAKVVRLAAWRGADARAAAL